MKVKLVNGIEAEVGVEGIFNPGNVFVRLNEGLIVGLSKTPEPHASIYLKEGPVYKHAGFIMFSVQEDALRWRCFNSKDRADFHGVL